MDRQFVIGSAKDFMYGMVHEPAIPGNIHSNILVCQPLGIEWSNAYLPVVRLSRMLASKGHRVFRFDYMGTGDSAGKFGDMKAAKFTDNIYAMALYIHQCYKVSKITLVAFRAAALFVFPLLNDPLIERICLVDPVLEPKKYIKELAMTDNVPAQNGVKDKHAAGLNSGGYVFSDALMQSLVASEPGDEALQNNKLQKIFFSRRGLLSNAKTHKRSALEFMENIWEVEPAMEAFWNKPGIASSPIIESRLLQLLS